MISLARNLHRTAIALTGGNFTPRFSRVALCAALLCADADPKPSALWKKHFEKRKPVIAKFQAAINREIGFAKSDVLRKIARAGHAESEAVKSADGGTGAASDFLFDLDDLDAGLLATLRKEHAEALQTAGNELFDEIGSDDVFTMPPKAAKEFIAARENRLSGVSQEIFDSIKADLQEGIDAGESNAKLAARIESKFGEIEEGRAATIASTEVSAAYGFARDEAMKQAGIEYKQWLGSGLPTMRDTHREASAEGQTVPLDKPFVVGGEELMYPGDPDGSPGNVINCHCVSIPVETAEGIGGVDAEETRARDACLDAGAIFSGGPGSGRYPKGSGAGRRAVGKEGDWKNLNLPSAENLPPVSGASPERISSEEALARLKNPYAKEDPIGNTVGFGTRLKEHMEMHPDDARPGFLPHMEATVEHPAEIWQENTTHGPRMRHIGVFQHEDGRRTFAVISHQVGATEANVVTGTPKTFSGINNYRKGKLLYANH